MCAAGIRLWGQFSAVGAPTADPMSDGPRVPANRPEDLAMEPLPHLAAFAFPGMRRSDYGGYSSPSFLK